MWRSISPRASNRASASCSNTGVPLSSLVFSTQDRLGECRRDHEPARPQRRGQRLADRAEVDHAVRRQPLQRADGCAVVAVLGVVVVLEDQPVPFEQPCAARRAEHDPGRELVRGRDQHDPRAAALEGGDVEAFVVDRHRRRAPARRPRAARWTGSVPGSSSAIRVMPRFSSARVIEREALRDAGRDHGRGRVGDHAAHAAEIGRELRAQLHRALRVRVAEPVVGRRLDRLRRRVRPRLAREQRRVGRARAQIEPRRPGGIGRGRDRLGGRGALLPHARRRPAPRHQVALGGELRVRVAHHAAGHGQLARQHPGGRQRGARPQLPGSHRLAQPALELQMQGNGRPAIQAHEQLDVGSGLHQWAGTGPRQCSTRTVPCGACRPRPRCSSSPSPRSR